MTKTVKLTHEDRRQLQAILANVPDFSQGGQRGRQILLSIAGLDDLIPGIALDGLPRTVAGETILTAERYGFLPSSHFYALGALLDYLIGLGGTRPADASFMARIIVKYELSKDAAYIEGLRDKYDLADVIVKPVENKTPELSRPPIDYYDRRFLSRLRDTLIDRLNADELQQLCFDAGIKYDNLRGSGLGAKAQALIEYLDRRRCVPEFIKVAKEKYDYIDWEAI